MADGTDTTIQTSSTTTTQPAVCQLHTAGLATIRKHNNLDVGKHLAAIGVAIQRGWINAAEQAGLLIEVGGIPPMSHFIFEHEQAPSLKSLFVQLMLEKGFLASTIFDAMYAHKFEHVDSYLEAVNDSFAKIAKAVEENKLLSLMKGKPTSVGFQRLT